MDGITEDAEEDPAGTTTNGSAKIDEKNSAIGIEHKVEDNSSLVQQKADAASVDETATPTINGDPSTTPRPTTPVSQTQRNSSYIPPNLPDILNIRPNYATSEVSLKRYDMRPQDEDASAERRLSSQTLRPPQSDKYDFSAYGIKPKIKLGPRLFTDGRRPPSTTSAKSVSTLPAGVKIATRASDKQRPTTKPAKTKPQKEKLAVPRSVISNLSTPVPSPPAFPLPPPPPVSSPARSTFSTKSGSSYSSMPAKSSPGISREKLKLRKALELRRKQLQSAAKPAEASVESEANQIQENPALNSSLENKPAILVKEPDEHLAEERSKRLAESSASKPDSTKGSIAAVGMEASVTTLNTLSGSTEFGSVSNLADPIGGSNKELDIGTKNVIVANKSYPQEHARPSANNEASDTNQHALQPDEAHKESSKGSDDTTSVGPQGNGSTDPVYTEKRLAGSDLDEEDPAKQKDLAREKNAQLKADSGVGLLADSQIKPEVEISAAEAATSQPEKLINSGVTEVDTINHKETARDSTNVRASALSTKHLLPTDNQMRNFQDFPPENKTHDRVRSNTSFDLPLQGIRESFDGGQISHNLKSANDTSDKSGMEGKQVAAGRSESPARNMQPIVEASSPAKSDRNISRPTSKEATDLKRSGSQLRERRGNLEPMQIDLSPASSEADSFSDDSLMEELQSAKVQEAKPISVSKSPINPFFPRRPSATSVQSSGKRSMSANETNAWRKNPNSGSPASGKVGNGVRSFSASPKVLHEHTAVPKKVNVSSGISQRIKALTQRSGRTSPPPPVPSISKSSKAESSLVSQRMSSFRSDVTKPPVLTPNMEPTPKSVKRSSKISFTSRPSSPPNTAPASTPAKRSLFSRDMNASKIFSREANSSKLFSREANSSKIFSREANSSKISLSSLSITKSKPESMSVTARIVRDGRPSKREPQQPPLSTRHNSSPLELHKSQLTIEHQHDENRAVTLPTIPAIPMEAPSPTKSSSRPRSFQGALPRSSSESSWRQFRRRQSDAKATPPPSSSKSISNSSFDDEERVEEKRASRTSRLFKRMSSTITGTSRKGMTVLSPILREEEHEIAQPTVRASHTQLGDLNVQFPDTLVSFPGLGGFRALVSC